MYERQQNGKMRERCIIFEPMMLHLAPVPPGNICLLTFNDIRIKKYFHIQSHTQLFGGN